MILIQKNKYYNHDKTKESSTRCNRKLILPVHNYFSKNEKVRQVFRETLYTNSDEILNN